MASSALPNPEVRPPGLTRWEPRRTHERSPASCKRRRGLRHGAPEVGVVGEDDAPARLFERFEFVERSEHLFLVVGETRQAALAQRLAEIAGVGGEDDLAAL